MILDSTYNNDGYYILYFLRENIDCYLNKQHRNRYWQFSINEIEYRKLLINMSQWYINILRSFLFLTLELFI